MKTLVLASLLISSSAFADTTLFNCTVPSSTNSVKATFVMADDQSSDFITLNLVEKSGTTQFYTQGDKGSLTAQIGQGFLQFMAMTEKTGQTAEGVIVNTGFVALSKEADGTFGGFLTAKGNIYPLACTK